MAEERRGFSELRGRPASRGICPRCNDQTAGSVFISARSYGPQHGSLKGGRTLASRSLSLCEFCTVEVYERLEGQFASALVEADRG